MGRTCQSGGSGRVCPSNSVQEGQQEIEVKVIATVLACAGERRAEITDERKALGDKSTSHIANIEVKLIETHGCRRLALNACNSDTSKILSVSHADREKHR